MQITPVSTRLTNRTEKKLVSRFWQMLTEFIQQIVSKTLRELRTIRIHNILFFIQLGP